MDIAKEIARRKKNLKKHKVDLQIADEVSSALDNVLTEQQALNNAANSVQTAIQNINYSLFEEMELILGDDGKMENLASELNNALNNMDTKAGELGLSPMDFSPDYVKAIEVLGEIERDSLSWNDMWEKASEIIGAGR